MLDEFGYPPVTIDDVYKEVLEQAENFKKYGIPGRPRLFEVIQKVKRINKERQEAAPGHKFIGQSFHSDKLSDPSVALAYITAPPRM